MIQLARIAYLVKFLEQPLIHITLLTCILN